MSTHRTREEWRAVIEQQRLSGLSQTRFCRQHGITTSAFSNARQRLSSPGGMPSAFVPALPPGAVGATATETSAIDDVPLPPYRGSQLSLLLPGGTLCLPADISPRWLATLLREMAP